MDKTHLLSLSSCQIHIPLTMRLCNSRIPKECLVCYQTSQRNLVIINMLYTCSVTIFTGSCGGAHKQLIKSVTRCGVPVGARRRHANEDGVRMERRTMGVPWGAACCAKPHSRRRGWCSRCRCRGRGVQRVNRAVGNVNLS